MVQRVARTQVENGPVSLHYDLVGIVWVDAEFTECVLKKLGEGLD